MQACVKAHHTDIRLAPKATTQAGCCCPALVPRPHILIHTNLEPPGLSKTVQHCQHAANQQLPYGCHMGRPVCWGDTQAAACASHHTAGPPSVYLDTVSQHTGRGAARDIRPMHAPSTPVRHHTRGRGLASTQQQAPQPAASTSGTPTTCVLHRARRCLARPPARHPKKHAHAPAATRNTRGSSWAVWPPTHRKNE